MDGAFGRTSRKPAVKLDQIVRELRRQIVEGVLPPGARLPIRKEIEATFDAGIHTVQNALEQLTNEGFVRARGVRGTFVVDMPPHLCRYALVFAHDPKGPRFFPQIWTALANEATEIARDQPGRFAVYYGIDGHSDTEDYQRLLSVVRSQRVAGLIFPNMPNLLVGSPLLTEPGMPRASVYGFGAIPGIALVMLDRKRFIEKALDYFVAQGRKRVALIIPAADEFVDDFMTAVAERPLETRPYWIQMVVHGGRTVNKQAVSRLVQLLMRKGHDEVPDALLIGDDNHVESATEGLLEAGARVPEELTVVAHCNFPWPTPAALPVKRLGYHARHVLQACVGQIDYQRREHQMPKPVTVEAVFDDQVS